MADLARINQMADANDLVGLKALAVSQGLVPHPRMKAQTIAKMILEHVAHPKQDKKLQHPAEQSKKVEVLNSADDVRKACAAYFDKPGFEATFNDDETWHFKCRGAEDSGHMTVSLRVIRMKAEMVAQGRRAPMAANGDFGRLPGADTPNTAYTNVVLNA